MPSEPTGSQPWRTPRKHPRVRLVTQVESRTSGQVSLGRVENISIGGMLILTKETFEPGTDVLVRFNLPSGPHIETQGRIQHAKPGSQMGVHFLDLKEKDLQIITSFVQEVKPYDRRSARLPRRTRLVLRWDDSEGKPQQEAVETRLWSRHGGMVRAENPLKPGTEIVVEWPEKKKQTRARVVNLWLTSSDEQAHVAFEFLEPDNFWEMDFPPDPKL